jgi:hypothetical protein
MRLCAKDRCTCSCCCCCRTAEKQREVAGRVDLVEQHLVTATGVRWGPVRDKIARIFA